ncbi:hypothetical protein ACS0ZG_01100 [Burkholderia gladioli]|uniref:hypothetical protein n=1 Tax=Burkholderia gladioli TaxID=28095 RepID=UPI000B1D89BC
MNKRPTSRRSARNLALKGKIDELNSIVEVIKALKNEPDRVVRVKTVVSRDQVVVKVVPKSAKDLAFRKAKAKARAKTALPRSGEFKGRFFAYETKKILGQPGDRSIEDTDRAVRTLSTAPSEEVLDFYKKLSAMRDI